LNAIKNRNRNWQDKGVIDQGTIWSKQNTQVIKRITAQQILMLE
jgi:hypothetical protein